ncbi:FAD-dependent thymidylate synthase [bacterium]|nr:FAD-dependent thymidylate synthase [bacterium]
MNEKNNKPVVKLISKPENMLKTIYTACRTCYSADSPINIYENATDEEKMLNLIKNVVASGHHSTIEHIQVSFAISNVSRACTHQLVRHRLMSFSQKSQRYVKEKGQFDFIIPPTIEKNPELKTKFIDFMSEISNKYQEFIEAGIPAEDARFVLPNAAASSLVASLNLRELIHLANLRLCTRTQYEIRYMVKEMCRVLIEQEPWLKDYLVPKCDAIGFCDEHKPCGRKITKSELFEKAGI